MSPRVPAARDRSGRRKIRAEDQWKDQEWGECRSLGLSHLSRRRAFGATLVLRLEPPRRCTSVADDSPLPPHYVPLSRIRSLAFLHASTAYMNSTSSANTFTPRRCRWGILSPAWRSPFVPTTGFSRTQQNEYNANTMPRIQLPSEASPIFIFNNGIFDRPRFSFSGNVVAVTTDSGTIMESWTIKNRSSICNDHF